MSGIHRIHIKPFRLWMRVPRWFAMNIWLRIPRTSQTSQYGGEAGPIFTRSLFGKQRFDAES